MKRKRSLLPFYIIIIPIAGLAILLNSGILQQNLKAVTIGGYDYTSAEYNYYYYSQYNSFIKQNKDELEELGFDSSIDEKKQEYNDEMTWQEYFSSLAEQRMLEVTALNSMAEKEGYVFQDEVFQLVEEKIADAETAMLEDNITDLENYLLAYYNNGMTNKIFEEQLLNEVKADAYKASLKENQELTQNEIDEYLVNNNAIQKVCEVRIIALYPSKDRYTGEVESQQWEDLSNKMKQLFLRYQKTDRSEEAFIELSVKYSDSEDRVSDRGLYQVDANSEEEIVNWAFDEKRMQGDVERVKTKTGEYLLYYVEGNELIVREVVESTLKDEKLESVLVSNLEKYSIKKHGLGMQLCM